MPSLSIRRTSAAVLVALVSLASPAARSIGAQGQTGQPALLSGAQLDQIVGPVALYPDPLLAQVLLAATFPDQVRDAAEYVRANGQAGIDDQAWDVSVKAVAHYPSVLNTMDTRADWTLQLGQAYVTQSSDVMASVQRLRRQANANGNLASTPQQQVVVQPEAIAIWPAQPEVIYVPVYDPAIVYVLPYRPGFRSWVTFSIGFPIGAWLIYDWDWPSRRIIYTGWRGGGWVGRSRPYIVETPIYVHERYRTPYYNRDVIQHAPIPRTAVPRDGPAGRAEPRAAVPREGGERVRTEEHPKAVKVPKEKRPARERPHERPPERREDHARR
jgi:hypothetical protein